MLRDSYDSPHAGYHVEQVEITFALDCAAGRIAAAWDETVAATEALRTAFDFSHGIPTGCHGTRDFPAMEIHNAAPTSWESWREADRCRPLLFPDEVPWRIACWPQARRLVWTFHHALLDGRSITRILRGFLARLEGDSAEALPLAKWNSPSPEAVELATQMFQEMPSIHFEIPHDPSPSGPALRCLGNEFAMALEARAAEIQTTAATLLTWAWGCALADFSGTDAVMVEQVRAGAPQPGTAGFTMNVLPLLIRRCSLQDFQADLLALRDIESVSFSDFAAGIYPDVHAPGISTIMVEHSTLHHSIGQSDLIESIILHERGADALMATAHLLPDFRLEVEGPHRHELLDEWIEALQKLERGIHPA